MKLSDLITAAEQRQAAAVAAVQRAEDALTVLRSDPNLTEDLVEQRVSARDVARREVAAAETHLTNMRAVAAEEDEVQRLANQSKPTDARLPAGRAGASEARWVRTNDMRSAVVGREQRFAAHEIVADEAARFSERDKAVIGQHGSFGNLVRSMSTTSGSAIVPTVWASDIIDRARNMAAVLQAGAEIVPMDAKVMQIGRLTTDPTAAFRAEGSLITASDPVFDNVTLTATTMSALVVGSLEWFQDANNVDEVVSQAIAKAVALQLDLAALFGGLTSGSEGFNLPNPPNPRGILATLLAVAAGNVLGSGANGTPQTALTFWNEVLDTIYTPRDNNEAPNAMIWNSKLARQYAKAYDSQGRILTPPPDVDGLQRFISNQIPSFTQGTMTGRATDLFVGDFRQCLIGQRLGFQIQTLTERYAELGQIGIIATWRGDVQLARPKAFSVYRYLQGA